MKQERRIKYSIKIDQRLLWESGIRGVDGIDILIYEFICGMLKSKGTSKLLHENQVYVWVSASLIIEQMPYLSRNHTISKRTISDRIKKLEKACLVMRHPNNQAMGKAFFAVADFDDMDIEYSKEDDLTLEEFRIDPWKNSAVDPSEISLTTLSINKALVTTLLDKEKRAQENKVEELEASIEQHQIKYEEQRTSIPSFDPKICEGNGIEIKSEDFPKDKDGKPFPHPDSNPAPNFDLWWSMYGINQTRGQCEGLFRGEHWPEIYRHTFLMVAVTGEAFRSKPANYLRRNEYKDDIIDRRRKEKQSTNGYQRPQSSGLNAHFELD